MGLPVLPLSHWRDNVWLLLSWEIHDDFFHSLALDKPANVLPAARLCVSLGPVFLLPRVLFSRSGHLGLDSLTSYKVLKPPKSL